MLKVFYLKKKNIFRKEFDVGDYDDLSLKGGEQHNYQ